MIIIAHNVTIVNAKSEEKTPATPKYLEKWEEHKRMNERVAQKMIAIGYTERGERMNDCAKQITFVHCDDCDRYSVARTNLCRDRFCPTCNWRLALQRYINMKRVTERLMTDYNQAYYSFVTLTVENCRPDALNETMVQMAKTWNRLLQRQVIKDEASGVAGWAKSVEITYNPKAHTMHPHYHLLILWRKNDRSRELVNGWLQSCERSGLRAVIEAQDWQPIQDKGNSGDSMAAAICETFKYAVKSKQLDDMTYREFKILVDEIAGKRLVSFGGIIKDIVRDLKIDMESLSDEEVTVCRHCGSVSVDKLVYQWAFGKYFHSPGTTEFIG